MHVRKRVRQSGVGVPSCTFGRKASTKGHLQTEDFKKRAEHLCCEQGSSLELQDPGTKLPTTDGILIVALDHVMKRGVWLKVLPLGIATLVPPARPVLHSNASLLEVTLNEEKETDAKLTDLAKTINVQANEEGQQEEREESKPARKAPKRVA